MPRSIDLTGYGLPYWLDIERPRYPALAADTRADAAVIGAGIAGLKLADYLAAQGLSCVVVEAKRVGEGASSRNQGCIVTGLPVSYADLAAARSRAVARGLVELCHHNQELLEEQMARHGIACDYEVLGETLLVRGDLADHEQVLAAQRRDASMMTEDGFAADCLDAAEARAVTGNPLFAGGIRFGRDAQFHSGRFVVGLGAAVARSPRVRIFEESPVEGIESPDGDAHLVRTTRGSVRADHLCVATNALVPQLLPELTSTLRAERGQVLVTAPLDERPCRGCFAAGTAWWREIREADGRYRLLFGGGRSRDEPDSLFPQYGANGRRSPPHRRRRLPAHGGPPAAPARAPRRDLPPPGRRARDPPLGRPAVLHLRRPARDRPLRPGAAHPRHGRFLRVRQLLLQRGGRPPGGAHLGSRRRPGAALPGEPEAVDGPGPPRRPLARRRADPRALRLPRRPARDR